MPSQVPARDREPSFYRIAMNMQRRGVRGSTRVLRLLRSLGYLDRPVDFSLSPAVKIRIPIARNEYDQAYLDDYEQDLFKSLQKEIQRLPAPVTLLDVGADIGLFSMKLLAGCPSIRNIVAFEPNGEGFPWLQFNLSRLPQGVQGTAHAAAVSDFEGSGRLAIPDARFTPGMESNHTQFFLEPAPDGPIPVITIDSLQLPLPQSAVLKIDVEGGELSVLRGAAQAIAKIPNLLVVLEAHPAVAQRTGVDPVRCLQYLSSLRPFQFVASETGTKLHTNQNVFDQIPPDQVYNIIARC
jgi:FkbM family methyltransferase